MSSFVIDRRLNAKNKSAVNRRRFLQRYKKHIKKAVNDAVNSRSITDMESGESISIPAKDISEPSFGHGQGGRNFAVHPGNKEFVRDDRINKPPAGQGQGRGGKASDSGESMDEFTFQITQDEFLEFLFEDLELPNLEKKELKDVKQFEYRQAGFSNTGTPSKLNIVRSLKNSHARRIALSSKSRRELKEVRAQLQSYKDTKDFDVEIELLKKRQVELRDKIKRVPYIEELDLRFNRHEKVALPSNAAVMFCLMDVSGSMTQHTKDIAKRFYLLLYMFLQKNYEKIDIVFIRHHTSAKEVDEEEFFYSRETGGTIVSSALLMMDKIIKERYPKNSWNIYAAQASDGDNWNDDSPLCSKLLNESIMSMVQFFTYIEITPREHQTLWYEYENIQQSYPNKFSMQQVVDQQDIFPIFRKIFKRKMQQ